MNIGLDIGYGDVKIAYQKNGNIHTLKFPTAISKRGYIGVDFSSSQIGYEFENELYEVGEDAVLDSFFTRDVDYIIKYAPLFLYHALKLLNIPTDTNLRIATGLSIHNWNKRQEFLNSFKNSIVDGKKLNANYKIMAQGEGILFDSLDETEREGYISVLDIGYNTLDFLSFKNGRPEPKYSFAKTTGVNKIIAEIKKILDKKFELDLTEQEIKDAFVNGYIEDFGEKLDITNFKHIGIKNYIEKYIKPLFKDDNMRAYLRKCKMVIVSGGGAYLLEEIKDLLPKNFKFSKKPYEFSNVRGYFKSLQELK